MGGRMGSLGSTSSTWPLIGKRRIRRRDPSKTSASGQKQKMFTVRIHIREQLSFLVGFVALSAVGVLAAVLWHNSLNYILSSRSERLSLIADLKAAQLTQAVSTYYTSVSSLSTRSIPVSALRRYDQDGNNTDANWNRSLGDVGTALSTQPFLLEVTIWSKNLSAELLNVTSAQVPGIVGNAGNMGSINGADSTTGYNWNGHQGFSDQLFPRSSNISSTNANKSGIFTADYIVNATGILLGPVQINETFYMASFTVPMYDVPPYNRTLLGFMTVVVNAELILDIIDSGNSTTGKGQSLLVGPANATNVWPPGTVFNDDTLYRYVMPPTDQPNLFGTNETMGKFKAVEEAYITRALGSATDTRNAQNERISVGYRVTNVNFTDWAMITEMDYSEVVKPITPLRNALIATVFGTVGVVLLFIFPAAHFAVRPISRLKHATERTELAKEDLDDGDSIQTEKQDTQNQSSAAENGYILSDQAHRVAKQPRTFRIPNKVPEKPHYIEDELTDLTHTFNEMTDELVIQYEHLEDRVRQRTVELEEQKKLAEAANEAKTLFLANVTHELRTPLNGILGMCAISMQEDDVPKIRKSLQIVYKSGELLLALITDLLTLSKNHFDHHVTLEEACFKSTDLINQLQAIFDKQARDKKVSLSIEALPEGVINKMYLWGDNKRIAQVLINLISNSLKFTSEGGSISVTMKLLGPPEQIASKTNATEEYQAINKPGALSRIISKTTSLKNKSRPYSSSSYPVMSQRGTTIIDDSILVMNDPSDVHLEEDVNLEEPEATKAPDGSQTNIFEFSVTDNGPGIAPEMHEKIFEPFVQEDKGLARKFGGTGLGLSICRQLAVLMSGKIELQKSDSTGSTFAMTIPLKSVKTRSGSISSKDNPSSQRSSVLILPTRPTTNASSINLDDTKQESTVDGNAGLTIYPASFKSESVKSVDLSSKEPVIDGESKTKKTMSPQKTAPKKGPSKLSQGSGIGKNLRVLVTDDNAINREVVIRMLKFESVTDVSTAKDGQEAVDCVTKALSENQKFDLIFMDVQMPNMDGLESTRQIRKLGYQAPIVALTAFDDDSNVKDCYESGMDYFLSKPIKRAKVKHVLQTYCPTIREEESSSPDKEAKNPMEKAKVTTAQKKSTENNQPKEKRKEDVPPKEQEREHQPKDSKLEASKNSSDSGDTQEVKPQDNVGATKVLSKESPSDVPDVDVTDNT